MRVHKDCSAFMWIVAIVVITKWVGPEFQMLGQPRRSASCYSFAAGDRSNMVVRKAMTLLLTHGGILLQLPLRVGYKHLVG